MAIYDKEGMSLIDMILVAEVRMAQPPEPPAEPETESEPAPTEGESP
jgi:hypothetical protein